MNIYIYVISYSLFLFNYALSKSDENGLLPDWSSNSQNNLEEVKQLLQFMNMRVSPSRRASANISNDILVSKEVQELLEQYKNSELEPIPDTFPSKSTKMDDYLYQGDILLTTNQAKFLANTARWHKTRSKRQTANYGSFRELWNKKKPILYDAKQMSRSAAKLIRKVIKFWSKNTCLKFRETSPEKAQIRFVPQSGCWSYVGRQTSWGRQEISIGKNCDYFGTVAHEIAHALGFLHTQSRGDRDNYVTINFFNINASRIGNFMKEYDIWETYRLTSYDFGSVMHYSPYAFALNPRVPTVLARDWRFQATMGQPATPSFSDIKAMNLLYKCNENCKQMKNCMNGGYVSPKQCSLCICPPQFKGSTCSQLKSGNLPTCNSKHLKANSTWQYFEGTFGLKNKTTLNDYKDCNYLIEGNKGSRVSIKLTLYSAPYCYSSCPWQAVEISATTFDVTGMRYCCRMDNILFNSQTELLSIRGLSKFGTVSFTIWYIASP